MGGKKHEGGLRRVLLRRMVGVRLRCLRREGGDLRKMLPLEVGSRSLDGMGWDGMEGGLLGAREGLSYGR